MTDDCLLMSNDHCAPLRSFWIRMRTSFSSPRGANRDLTLALSSSWAARTKSPRSPLRSPSVPGGGPLGLEGVRQSGGGLASEEMPQFLSYHSEPSNPGVVAGAAAAAAAAAAASGHLSHLEAVAEAADLYPDR